MRMPAVFFIVSLLGPFCAAAQRGMEPVTVTDLLKIKSIGGITLSHDGSKAAFTVTAIEPDPEAHWEYKYINQVWMVNTSGNAVPRQITTRESASQPAFSPDGRQLVFVRLAEGKPQLFLIAVDGGEAVQLTHFKYGAGSPKWSPNGKQILFSYNITLRELSKDSLLNPRHAVPAWPLEKPGFPINQQPLSATVKPDPDGSLESVRAYLENNVTDKKAKVLNRLDFQDETETTADIRFNHYAIIPAQPGAMPANITSGFNNFYSAEFTPDGRQILLSGHIDSLQHPDRLQENAIFLANADGTHLRQILGSKGKIYSSPQVSPSGKWLAFQSSPAAQVKIPAVYIMPLNGTEKDTIALPLDRARGNFTWSNDERYLYCVAQSNGAQPLYRTDIKTRQSVQLTDDNSGIVSFDLINNTMVFVKTEVANPYEVYKADASAQHPERISNFNDGWVKQKQLSFPEKKSFVNNLGQKVEYWIMKPTGFKPGNKYPLLLNIHGGPSAMWGPGETSMWHEFQFWCSKGYGLVYCNPRGSGGYGLDFLRANVKDWGAGPASDVLTALDSAVAAGWADTAKLVVSGGSYAGYLVAWIIAHDHRFKAACSQRGVYSLPAFFGEGNAWRLVPNYFGGYPWESATRTLLEHESPITYVQDIITPYIIFHGENDRRTGFVQSEMLYRSLKVLGRPVEYVRHTGGTHELTRSGNNRQRIDQMLRTWEFFERWIH